MKRKFELEVLGSLQSLPEISEFINRTMKQINVQNASDIYEVRLSVDEACTNIIEHAYLGKGEGRIVISCKLSNTGDEFVVRIIDWGMSFDPTTLSMPVIQGNLMDRKEGGLGLFLMRKFMDKVKYSSTKNQNKLVMVKNLQTRKRRV